MFRLMMVLAATLLLNNSAAAQPAPDIVRKLSPEELLQRVDKAFPGGAAFVKAARGDLTLTIVERGNLEAVDCTDVVVRVRPQNKKGFVSTIKWVVDDGAMVKKGERLVVLDDKELQEEARDLKVTLEQRKAALTLATQGLSGMKAEVDTENRLGEINVRLAQAALKKGDGDRETLELKVEQAGLLLERTRNQGRAKITQAEAEVATRKTAVETAAARLKDVLADVAACVMHAPQDGFAVHYMPTMNRLGGGAALVAVGEPVREGQKLLRVCDLKRMQLTTRVQEAQISQVKTGQIGSVRIDAYPGKTLEGKVQHVAKVASQADWFAANVKVYAVQIALPENAALNLKPGMSGEARIVAARKDDVLIIPGTAMVRAGADVHCYVKVGNALQRRPIGIGLRGDQGVEVKSGLKGDELILRDVAVLGKLIQGADPKP